MGTDPLRYVLLACPPFNEFALPHDQLYTLTQLAGRPVEDWFGTKFLLCRDGDFSRLYNRFILKA